jgi:hypothetical protein
MILATAEFEGHQARVAASGPTRIVEILEQDSQGGPRWTELARVRLDKLLVSSSPSDRALALLFAALDSVAAERDALQVRLDEYARATTYERDALDL